jgi:S-adenosyl methyltransferase
LPEGATAYIDADLREPEKILNHPDLLRTLDLSQPTGLLLVAILHFIMDADDPYGVVGRLVGAMPSGSHLVVSHVTADPMPPEVFARTSRRQRRGRDPVLVPDSGGVRPLPGWAGARPPGDPVDRGVAGRGRAPALPVRRGHGDLRRRRADPLTHPASSVARPVSRPARRRD